MSLFDRQDPTEIESEAFPGERLILCSNSPLANEGTRGREDLLHVTERSLDTVVAATPCGARRIGPRVGKHFQIEIEGDRFARQRDPVIAGELALDGLYVLRTSLPKQELGRARHDEGLLRGMAHALPSGPASVRRGRSVRGRGAAQIAGGDGQNLA